MAASSAARRSSPRDAVFGDGTRARRSSARRSLNSSGGKNTRYLLRLQVAVDELHGHRALTRCGSDTLDRSGAHVTRSEHARGAGLQVEPNGVREVRAGEDEASTVLLDVRCPIRVRLGTNEDEQPCRFLGHDADRICDRDVTELVLV